MPEMTILSKDEIDIKPTRDGVHIIAAVLAHGDDLWYEKYHISDLPNSFISLDDLERFGIDPTNGLPINGNPPTFP